MEPQERHYNIHKLNIIFAVSSVVLLVSLIWLFADDYSRTWKDYQREFRALEIEKTRVKYDAAAHQLKEDQEYQTLRKELEEAQKSYQAGCVSADLEKEKTRLEAQRDLVSQQYKFAKAEYDALRYRQEAAAAHHEAGAVQSRQELDEAGQKLGQLKLSVEKAEEALQAKVQAVDSCAAALKDLQRKERSLTAKAKILDLKLAKIDPAKMSFINQMADIVRDLPVIDLANPNYKIEQIVLKDITEDINFTQVPKVDRCVTCHLGIANPDYQDAPQPFTTHPHLELWGGDNSPHPLEEVGCTVCHGGRGRGTDFVSAAHTPASPQQKKEWEEKYHWHEYHHWASPMLPMPYVEAGCFKCHSGQATIRGAEKLDLGINLIEKTGCYNCHFIEQYKDWPKPGPDLTKVRSKVSKEWAYNWIRDPHTFRSNTWMPAFFRQSNTSDPESVRRTDQEIQAVVHYLFEKSGSYGMKEMPSGADPKRGEEIVASVGCLGCHRIDPEEETTTRKSLRRDHGPSLRGLAEKTSVTWIYNWLKDPHRYNPLTRMPNLRLSDQEAADAAAYLASLNSGVYAGRVVPPIEEQAVDQMVLGFLTKFETTSAAQARLASMSLDEKLMYAGEKLIRNYGCFSCHNIAGFEKDKPIGTELTEEGSKSLERLDFGFVDIEHANYAWFKQKLLDPRIFDRGRIKPDDEKLRMPNFHFTEEEAEAVVTVLLGLVKERPVSKIVPRTAKNLYMEEGRKMVHLFNCQGCHVIEGEGGAVQPMVQEWLIRYDGRSETEAEALVKSFSPPNLVGEGKKVQAPWLFDFLHEPAAIRPWLKVRMPTYNFEARYLNAFVRYFSALDDQDLPFAPAVDTHLTPEELDAAEKLFSKNYLDCAKCHIVGDKMPDGSPENWAPNFALAKSRLKPQWIIEWLKNPQDLLPGTKMPTYFDPAYFEASGPDDVLGGDEHEQIRVLRNYLMTLTGSSSSRAPLPTLGAAAEGGAVVNESAVPPQPSAASEGGAASAP